MHIYNCIRYVYKFPQWIFFIRQLFLFCMTILPMLSKCQLWLEKVKDREKHWSEMFSSVPYALHGFMKVFSMVSKSPPQQCQGTVEIKCFADGHHIAVTKRAFIKELYQSNHLTSNNFMHPSIQPYIQSHMDQHHTSTALTLKKG